MEENGSNYKDLIQKGRDWAEKKMEEGWRKTCIGFLSPEDIKEAGLTFNNEIEEVYDHKKGKIVKQARGYDSIPSQEYIREDSNSGQKGAKYVGASQQFLRWYQRRQEKQKEYVDRNEEHIKREAVKGSAKNSILETFGGEIINYK